MRDDYLWDRSGEADPELEQIERELNRFRYRPRPLDLPSAPEPVVWTRYALAAAILFAVLAVSVWLSVRRHGNPTRSDQPSQTAQNTQPPAHPAEPSEKAPIREHEDGLRAVNAPPVASAHRRATGQHGPAEAAKESGSDNYILSASLLDPEVASHMEKAQLLLRAFRNTAPSDEDGVVDISYERRQSHEILYQNMLLRREAESKGNVPVGELLGTLEPLLLDISNLPDSAREEEVQGIKDRIEKEQIVAALQSYSSMLAAAL